MDTHMRFSEAHNPRKYKCPGDNCEKMFIMHAALRIIRFHRIRVEAEISALKMHATKRCRS